MSGQIRVFLDTSALFASVYSLEGGAYKIMTLGEAESIRVLVSPEVLVEVEGALRRKAPAALGILARLLDRSQAEVIPAASVESVEKSHNLTGYLADAHVLAAAWEAMADYFVTLDREHFLGNTELRRAVPFPMGTPGDFLAWFRARFILEG